MVATPRFPVYPGLMLSLVFFVAPAGEKAFKFPYTISIWKHPQLRDVSVCTILLGSEMKL